jgi:hypothetical protein
MHSFIKRTALLAVAFATSVSCAEQQTPSGILQDSGFQADTLVSLVPNHNMLDIVDQNGQPVAGATVMIGYEPGNPFAGNVITANGNGQIAIPSDWKAALPVTVQAAGFVTTTVPVALPGDQTIKLSRQEGTGKFEIAGTPQNYGRLPTDGKVDFALVIPALSRESMLAFDISSVMSPESDTIEIIGNELKVPSNLSLPQQRENYIFPIEFNKPNYRTYVRDQGQYLVSATRGNFPLQRVVNDIRGGKSIFEVVNHFTFTEGGQQAVDVQANVAGVNVPVNQIPFNTQASVTAPQFPTGHVMLSVALLDNGGKYMPTDLKRLGPGQQMNLKSSGPAGSVLSLLLEETANFQGVFATLFEPLVKLGGAVNQINADPATMDFGKFSFAFLPSAGGVAPQFLPMIGKPSLSGQVLTLNVPALPNGLVQVASYLVLVEVEEINPGEKLKNERRTRLWEVWSNAWLGQVELPKIQFNRRPDRKYRWEVMFMARPANFVGSPNGSTGVDLNTVTHVTRNSVEI